MSKNTTTTDQTTPNESAQDAQALADGKGPEFRPAEEGNIDTASVVSTDHGRTHDRALPSAETINELTDELSRTFVRTESERRSAEALASDMMAREYATLSRPTIYCRPVLSVTTEALLGYEWVDGNGRVVEKPADFE